jgi:hypothetical protein
LRGHLRGFFSGTAEGDQNLGQFGDFHSLNNYACRLEFTL